MEPRPELKRQGIRISTIIVGVLAFVMVFVGILIFASKKALGFSPEMEPFLNIIGISCFVFAAFLFIIVNMARDLHYQSYLLEYYVKETAYYHTQSMQMIQSIEGMLRQQHYPQQTAYAHSPLTSSLQPSASQPEQQPNPCSQSMPFYSQAMYTETAKESHQPIQQDEGEPNYSAQYK